MGSTQLASRLACNLLPPQVIATPWDLLSAMSKLPPTTLCAIIVGAGPVGLYLAHALSRADIVLEQYESVPRYQGAGVLLYPQPLRLLDQVGDYEKVEKNFIKNHTQTELLTSNGQIIIISPVVKIIKKVSDSQRITPFRHDRLSKSLSICQSLDRRRQSGGRFREPHQKRADLRILAF
jgi:hypothetical protein